MPLWQRSIFQRQPRRRPQPRQRRVVAVERPKRSGGIVVFGLAIAGIATFRLRRRLFPTERVNRLQKAACLLYEVDYSATTVYDTWGMPKLYEYFGLIILFYSNEHEPIHVHGKYQGTESRADFIIDNGKTVGIQFSAVKGRRPLSPVRFKNFEVFVKHYAEDIVQKWIDYFVLHKPMKSEKITKKIR